ncbi:MAG: hypothetical protein ACKV2O_20890 [Acidimicrobiales bacterium]
MAGTFRHRIGPEVGDTFARTQAFMASVILEKLSAQLRLAEAHQAAERADRAVLKADLDALLAHGGSGADDEVPSAVLQAVGALAGPEEAGTALRQLVEALYAERANLGEARFEVLLGRVRTTLRSRVDRQMEFAA